MFSSTYDDGVTMLETNYYGVKKVTSGLQHLLRDESQAGARIVNVSSTTGILQVLCHTQAPNEFCSCLSSRPWRQ
jgi:NAD(P)-dependent dehydrogenase (short-subunit alcohol dehydrogenase family)